MDELQDLPPSFSEVSWSQSEAQDDDASYNNAMQKIATEGADLLTRPLELGEKADDAQDFDDISDDDLPDEESAVIPDIVADGGDFPGLTDEGGTSFETDDLFDEGALDDAYIFGSPPSQSPPHPTQEDPKTLNDQRLDFELNFPEHKSTANQDLSIPAPAESKDELVRQSWPEFEKGKVLFFSELVPQKGAHYVPKGPAKPNKPLYPTKVRLDIAPDQERAFLNTRVPAVLSDKEKRILEAEARGMVAIIEDSDEAESDEAIFDYQEPAFDEAIITQGKKRITWGNLKMACHDWEAMIRLADKSQDTLEVEDAMDEWDREFLGQSSKKRKTVHDDTHWYKPPIPVPSFDNFEEALVKIAKRPILDLNDPYLLLDTQVQPPAKRPRISGGFRRPGPGYVLSALKRRFNHSNDEAYDALKQNHQHKIRANQTNLGVEHSMPALRLQWPYYRITYGQNQLRSFHRPTLQTNNCMGQKITFAKLGMRKKKNVRNLSTQEIFKSTKDISLSEHYSTATLFEYLEEQPMVLSNFGMGSRVVNYYRRKDATDTERPAPEDKIGDTHVLLPEDKSPFHQFVPIDAGETVRCVQNNLYKAPIFKHEVNGTDFLMGRTTTGQEGQSWYIRNIDNTFAVGQQFPSAEVPTVSSRKQNMARQRIRMLGHRLAKHNKRGNFKLDDIHHHLGGDEAALRGKIKDYFEYDKAAGSRTFKLKEGEKPKAEEEIRSMIKADDVCLNDAMQVGKLDLEDQGFVGDENLGDLKDEDDKAPIAKKIAPWARTSAFIAATQGKAMLKLWGEGDPTQDFGFNFIRTNMKGGYIPKGGPSATSEGAIAERKATSGHKYNVKHQEMLYNNDIHAIWEDQRRILSDPNEYGLEDDELERQREEEEQIAIVQTPGSMTTPAAFDDSASQISMDHQRRQVVKITRKYRNQEGKLLEMPEYISDPRVWRAYKKKRDEIEREKIKKNTIALKPTGDPETDKARLAVIESELRRLEHNQKRTIERNKLKSKKAMDGTGPTGDAGDLNGDAGSPSGTPLPSIEAPSRPQGTTRKCAACGKIGHIKTNRKYCPGCRAPYFPKRNTQHSLHETRRSLG